MVIEYIQTRVEGAAKKSWVFKGTNKEYCKTFCFQRSTISENKEESLGEKETLFPTAKESVSH